MTDFELENVLLLMEFELPSIKSFSLTPGMQAVVRQHLKADLLGVSGNWRHLQSFGIWNDICQWKDLWLQRLFFLYSLSWGLFLQERIHAKAVNAHLCMLLILALREIFLYDEASSMYTWYDAKYEWTYSTLTLFWALWLLWGLARLYQLQPWKDTAWRISGIFVHFWFSSLCIWSTATQPRLQPAVLALD